MTPSESALLEQESSERTSGEVTYDGAAAAPMNNDGDAPGGMGCGAGARPAPRCSAATSSASDAICSQPCGCPDQGSASASACSPPARATATSVQPSSLRTLSRPGAQPAAGGTRVTLNQRTAPPRVCST